MAAQRPAPAKVKRVLTPEQMARLVGSMMAAADRRQTPDPRQSQPVSDEDLRSFPRAYHLIGMEGK